MKTQSIPSTHSAQVFEINETFFSTTNLKGTITSGNKVFSRTSGYSLPELVGSPHNIIRHPDMPRSVFAMLWEETQANRPFSGYVKNQAKNGNYYWVFALIEPINKELLSVRIKPSSKIVETIEGVYKTLLQEEEKSINNGETQLEAIQKSKSLLDHKIVQLGFPSYQAFSRYCLNLEIKNRDKVIFERKLSLFPSNVHFHDNSQFEQRYERVRSAYDQLKLVFSNIDSIITIANKIKADRQTIQNIATQFKLYSLNANIAATPLGDKGATIEVITSFLHSHANDFSNNTISLTEQISQTSTIATEIISRLASARIQLEMLISYIAEIGENTRNDMIIQLSNTVKTLESSFESTITQAKQELTRLQNSLPSLKHKNAELMKSIISFNVAQVTGLMECSRIIDGHAITSMFNDLRLQIKTAQEELANSDSAVSQLIDFAKSTPSKIDQAMSNIRIEHMATETA